MYTPNTNTISNSKLKTGQMNPNLLASRSTEKVLRCQEKKWRFIFRQDLRYLCIYKYRRYVYFLFFFFFNERGKYENFKYGQPKATLNVLTFNFYNEN